MKIRVATPYDAQTVRAIYAPYVERSAITFEYEVPSVAEFKQRITTTLQRYPYLVAEQDGQVVGYTYAGPFKARAAYDWCVETAIYVSQASQKHGVGRALYEALEGVLAAQHILNANACIACPKQQDKYLDKNSMQFHEHMGYVLVGEFHNCGYKFGTWYNMVWMEKMLGLHCASPQPVVWFSNITKEQLTVLGVQS